MYIISRDGTGDYTSIQAAVDAAPASSRHPVILLVKNGVYEERVIVNKDNLRIIGEDRESTVITHSACAKDLNAEGQPKGTADGDAVLRAARYRDGVVEQVEGDSYGMAPRIGLR